MLFPPNPDPPPKLSVVVKCLNEAANLDRCLRAVLACTEGWAAEVVLVDSISEDSSVELARRYPIGIVQLASLADRRCGAVAQLGYQVTNAEYLLIVDADMEVLADFVPAAVAALEREPDLAGVAGHVVEMTQSIEYRERRLRGEPVARAGTVRRLAGCVLYRRAALAEDGYFMDRNLHCFEEHELGVRLRSRGWRLRRLDMPTVRHFGHPESSVLLLRRRWRSRYLDGHGELLRNSFHLGFTLDRLWPCRLALMGVAWWLTLAALAVGAGVFAQRALLAAFVAVLCCPFIAILARKRDWRRASHSFLHLQFSAAAMIRGTVAPRLPATEPVSFRWLQRPPFSEPSSGREALVAQAV